MKKNENRVRTYMTSLVSRIHILTLCLELPENDFFFLTDGADMPADMKEAAVNNIPAYFQTMWSEEGRICVRISQG